MLYLLGYFLTSAQGINAVLDVFLFVEDSGEVRIDVLCEDDGSGLEPACRKLGLILAERGDLTTEDVALCLSAQKRIGEIALEKGLVKPSQVETALLEQEVVEQARRGRAGHEADASLRVSSEKLDKLVGHVGELVTASARLNRVAASGVDPRLDAVADLDLEEIRAEALRRGLIKADMEVTERELSSLVFAPGSSTARKVTGVSGRGVGMDVVKRAIDGLRGSIEISSRRGAGTVITIRLPLTRAIIESLLVKIGTGSFVLPLSAAEECIEQRADDFRKARLARVRGSLIPYIQLREHFSISGAPPDIQQIVIVRDVKYAASSGAAGSQQLNSSAEQAAAAEEAPHPWSRCLPMSNRTPTMRWRRSR